MNGPTSLPCRASFFLHPMAGECRASRCSDTSMLGDEVFEVSAPPYTRCMTPKVAEVLETVKTMTHAQRADLAYQVLLTLDDEPTGDPASVEELWRDEIGRRVDDYLAGNRNLVSIDESHAQIRAELTDARG